MFFFLIFFFMNLLQKPLICSAENQASPLSKSEKATIALTLHDMHEARLLLEDLQKEKPEDISTMELLFAYFCELKDIENIQSLYEKLCPEKREALSPALMEKIAWVVIEKALQSTHPRIRAEGAIAAAESHDCKGARMLATLLTDPHQTVRSLAFQLAIPYSDACIQERAEKLTHSPLVELKLSAAVLLAEQKAPCAEKILLALLRDETLSESDLFKIVRMAASLKKPDALWIQKAVTDPSPQTRALAAATLLEHPFSECVVQVIPLLADHSLLVRKMSATSLGLYQGLVSKNEGLLSSFSALLSDPCFSLQATAAWALLISPSKEHQAMASLWFQKNIGAGASETQCIAASRLIRSGEMGLSLAEKLLPEMTNAYVRINLARYLLLHKRALSEALSVLQSLSSQKTLLGIKEENIFSWIGPAGTHDPLIPRLPESQDLFIRLQLLALRHYSGDTVPESECETLLHERTWGLSAATAEFLFQEMVSLDEVLLPLLAHKEEAIRAQAAILLAIFSPSKKSAQILLDEYQKASKAGKEVLLLGFSVIPSSKTQSLLFPLLFDSSHILRTRAAGVFISSFYQ